MLIKLIKHDLKSTYRDLGAIYIGLVVSALLVALSSNITTVQLFPFVIIIMFALLVATGVILTITTLKLFTHRLYSSEGYLTLTLPVSTFETFLSKIITAILWSFATMAVIAFSLLISIGLVSWMHYDAIQEILVRYDVWTRVNLPIILNFIGQLAALSFPQVLVNMVYGYTLILFAVVVANTSYVSNHKLVVGILTYVVLNFIFTNLNANVLSDWLVQIEGFNYSINWLMYGLDFIYFLIISVGLFFGALWLNDHKLELQ